MLDKKFNEVIEELDKNMESKSDSKYAKMVITELTLVYLDEIHKLELDYEKRLKICNARLKDLEQRLTGLEDEIFDESDEEFFSVTCPYCNANIMVSSFEHDSEIECPECKNMIELDWEFDEDNELDDENDDSDDIM